MLNLRTSHLTLICYNVVYMIEGGRNMKSIVKIAIIGDYDGRVSHTATNAALEHAAAQLGLSVTTNWIPTEQLIQYPEHSLGNYEGIWCSPGSPYKSMTGALNGIRYARENKIPFIGTCGGFQHAVLEFARDVLDVSAIQDPNFDPYLPNDIITPLSCSLVGQTRTIRLISDSYMSKIYGISEIIERFNCTFGLSESFEHRLKEKGFEIQGVDEEENPRILSLKDNQFYVITLFQPQLSSTPEQPHPLIMEYLKICSQSTFHS